MTMASPSLYQVDDFIDGLQLEWFVIRKTELISTITSNQLVLATSIGDKVVTICSYYLLALSCHHDRKGQLCWWF